MQHAWPSILISSYVLQLERSGLIRSVLADMGNAPHVGHIKDEPADGQEYAREISSSEKPLWQHLPLGGGGLAQTL